MELSNCAKYQMSQGLSLWYGAKPVTDYSLKSGDKFDDAALSLMVLAEAATPEDEFINDFFWGKNRM